MAGEMRKREFMLPDFDSTFRVYAVHWRTVEAGWTFALHEHPLFEINLVLNGVQMTTVNGKQYVQQPGDLMILRPGDKHESKVVGTDEMTYYCIHFDVDERSFRELLFRNKRSFYEADSALAEAIRPALRKLLALTSEEAVVSVESRMYVLSALFELFAAISGMLSQQAASEPTPISSATASQAAAMLEEAVDRLADGTGVRDAHGLISKIALALGYSVSSINRQFVNAFGVSPRQYLSSLLLKKSKLLLLDPSLSVEQISSRMGYSNIAHFSRQFKRWSGESPSSFRRRFQG